MSRFIGSAMVVLSAVLLGAGCASRGPLVYQPAPLTAQEREELQTRTLAASLDTAFAATIAVLQDEEWDLQDIRKDSGVIQAVTKKRSDAIGPSDDWRREVLTGDKSGRDEVLNRWTRWDKLTAHMEPWGSGQVRLRLNITKFGTLPAITYSYPVGSFRSKKTVTVNALAKEEQVVVEEPMAYKTLFTRIEGAIVQRNQAQAAH